jgi:hypothetical protein
VLGDEPDNFLGVAIEPPGERLDSLWVIGRL